MGTYPSWIRTYSTAMGTSKFLGISHNSFNYQHRPPPRSQFASLAYIRQRIDYKMVSFIHRLLLSANTGHQCYIPALHRVSYFDLPRPLRLLPHSRVNKLFRLSWFSVCWNSLPPHTRSNIPHTAFKSYFKACLVSAVSISGPKQSYICASDSTYVRPTHLCSSLHMVSW